MTRVTVLLLLILGSLIPASGSLVLAGPPDVSCRSNGCNFGSDILVFAQGDASYEIDARIALCLSCTPPDPTTGIFSVILAGKIDFWTYDPALCRPAAAT